MTKASDVIAPSSDQNIVLDVIQWIKAHHPDGTFRFQDYDEALKAVWPALYKDDPGAAIFLSMNIYMEAADILDFEIQPVHLKRLKKEGLLL